MKKLFFLILVLCGVQSFGQLYQRMPAYGYDLDRGNFNFVLRPPADTTNNKTGIVRIGTTLYIGNGTYWTAASGGTTPTLQQVFDVEGSNPVMDKNNFVQAYGNQFVIASTDTTTFYGAEVEINPGRASLQASAPGSVSTIIGVEADSAVFQFWQGKVNISPEVNRGLRTASSITGYHPLVWNSTSGELKRITVANLLAGSTPTWQQTLTAGSTLTGHNTVDGGKFNLRFLNNDIIEIASNPTGLSSTARVRIDGAFDSDGIVLSSSNEDGDDSSYIKISHGLGIDINAKGGLLYVKSLISGAGTKALRINPTTGLVSYADTTTGGGSSTWNAITSPTADQALTFDAGESSTWTDANTTEDLFTVNSSTGTTNSMFSLNRTGTALASGNNILELVSSGANGTNAITATGARISVTNTNATSGTNVGLAVTATGATTNNYAIQATGNVTIAGPGTAVFPLEITNSVNGVTGFTVTNTNASSAAQIQNRLINNAGSYAYYGISSTGFTGYAPLTGGQAFYGSSASPVSIFTQSTQPIGIYPNGVLAMSIINGGAVGIGTTTPGTVNGTSFSSVKLQVSNAAASSYITTNTDLNIGGTGILFNRSAASANLRLWAMDSQPDLSNTSSKFTVSSYTDAGSPTNMLTLDRNAIMGLRIPNVTTQYDNTTTTLGNVTGLSYNVTASKKYKFEATLYTTSDVAGGIKVAIGGTATATSIIYEGITTDAGLSTQGRATALGTAVAGVTAVTAAYVTITGTIVVNASGTLTVQSAANAATGTTSVLVGSTFIVTECL